MGREKRIISTTLFTSRNLQHYEELWGSCDADKLREILGVLRCRGIIFVVWCVESNVENCMCILLNFLQNTIQLRGLDHGKNPQYYITSDDC